MTCRWALKSTVSSTPGGVRGIAVVLKRSDIAKDLQSPREQPSFGAFFTGRGVTMGGLRRGRSRGAGALVLSKPGVEIGSVVDDAGANLKKGRSVVSQDPQLIKGALAQAHVLGGFLRAELLAIENFGHL